MRTLSSLLLLSSLVSVSLALKCYVKVSTNKDYDPVQADVMDCGTSPYCVRQIVDVEQQGTRVQSAVFSCGVDAICTTGVGCTTNVAGVKQCCCNTDRCNNGKLGDINSAPAQGTVVGLGLVTAVFHLLH